MKKTNRKKTRTEKLERLIENMLVALRALGNSQFARIDARYWYDRFDKRLKVINGKAKS